MAGSRGGFELAAALLLLFALRTSNVACTPPSEAAIGGAEGPGEAPMLLVLLLLLLLP